MSVRNDSTPDMQPSPRDAGDTAPRPGTIMTTTARRLLAVLRIVTGYLFLWPFLDKTFGLDYATAPERAWINDGSPTKGFLSGVDVGPFAGAFRSLAGAPWADWLFMLGLLGIGLAVMLGVGLGIAAVAGTVQLLLMWAAEWPLARFTEAGEPSMSTNPIIDYHIVYALVLIVLAACYAGNTWGFGKRWAELPAVEQNRWLL
jgi:thiosulfate dehydrogenase [quinone] large subunit